MKLDPHYHISTLNIKLFSFFIFIFGSCISITYYTGAIDAFSPLHALSISRLVETGFGDADFLRSIPCFYSMGAVISLVCGIDGNGLIYLPIQLLPLGTIFYLLSRKLSNNPILSSILTATLMVSSAAGSSLFFYPHGLGFILFLLLFFLIINMITNKNNKSAYIPIFIISLVSLIFTSYDLAIMMGMLLLILMFFYIIKEHKKQDQSFENSHLILNSILIYIIVLLGLSGFVYDTLLPRLRTPGFFENPLSGIDKVIEIFSFKTNTIQDSLSLNYPTSVSYLTLIKYLIFILFIVILFIISIKKVNRNDNNIILVSFTLMCSIYIIVRSMIGALSISIIFYPGILCLAYVSSLRDKINIKYAKDVKFYLIICLTLLILTIASLLILEQHNLINNDCPNGIDVEVSMGWCFVYKDNNVLISDIQTRNEILYFVDSFNIRPIINSFDEYPYFQISSNEQKTSIKEITSNNTVNGHSYYVLNYNLNYLSIDEWKLIKGWNQLHNLVQSSNNHHKIYMSNGITLLY